ncbi:mRNA-processing endoribonuclease NDAI_0K02800 [Naumovozyma dairenensis CBS 421]|uniref:Transcriptional protein SWT1 n=1 Tax=Naumovozyma dairenensis (strain ATCC 10597 / BCRC 20456 / CBS 421 / NBRC 0211 / NRRL Y-12639) TaxID=1071378 RepID=G0WI60_NAUDC|nr:hypothetical protein NDAI_0K02800 [Naumovozyma dairenensis CBS 421]CCD27471.1 hypothetical protein NDAI_0K02800 [Naumovozyma dairenensis CBS 421]
MTLPSIYATGRDKIDSLSKSHSHRSPGITSSSSSLDELKSFSDPKTSHGTKYSIEDLDRIILQKNGHNDNNNNESTITQQYNDNIPHELNPYSIAEKHESNDDLEDDIPMVDINDENEIEQLLNYLSNERSTFTSTRSKTLQDDYRSNTSMVPQQEQLYEYQQWEQEQEHFTNNVSILQNECVSGVNSIANENTNNVALPKLKTMFVIDTNFIISHLNTLEHLRQLYSVYHHIIVIPNTVLQELDGLKSSRNNDNFNNKSTTVASLARSGNQWIYKNLANVQSGVVGQKLRERLNPNLTKDDSILDCCLYFKEKLNCFVILLSNDKNLCLKALTENILTVSYRDGMTAELIATKAYQENISRYGGSGTLSNEQQRNAEGIHKHITTTPSISSPSSELSLQQQRFIVEDVSKYIYEEIYSLVSVAIEHVLIEEYGEDLEYLGFDESQIKTLRDCTKILYKYWISVFSEYFKKSKLKQNDWKDLPQCLINAPLKSNDLKIFVQFWQDILQNLYQKRTHREIERLNSFFTQFHELLSRLS